MATLDEVNRQLQELHTTRQNIAATLASALIVASRRPHSVNETIALMNDFIHALWPEVSSDQYIAWKVKFKGDEPHE